MTKQNSNLRLIVEGLSLAKKTTLISYWVKNRPNIIVLSGEWRTKMGVPLMCTEGKFINLPQKQVRQAYNTILNFLELFPDKLIIFDRFHISQQFFDRLFSTDYYDISVENRLLKMNTVILYLRNQFDCYADALHDRLQKCPLNYYPPSWEEYRKQEKMFHDILCKTRLPYIEYDVTGKPVELISTDVIQKLKELDLL